MNGLQHTTDRVASTLGVDLALHHFISGDPGDEGADKRPTLLICHASGFHANCYRPMMPQLTAHFDVWGLDFRGHGASTTPAGEDFAWGGFADDVLAVVDRIGEQPLAGFGHSMGGASILLAETKRPGTFSGAYLYEPIIFPPDIVPRNSMMAEGARKRRREFRSRAEALHHYASRPPLGTMRADALAAYVEYGFHDIEDSVDGAVTLACEPEHEAATFNNAATSVDDISHLLIHAMVGAGTTLQEPSPAQFAIATAQALTNAELVSYDGIGHFGPMEDPVRIATDAVAFLTSVST